MHWSKPAVYGDTPSNGLRSHTATLVGSKIFVFGGGPLINETNDLLIFDTETMFWYKPATTGDIPGPHKAHTATLVDHKIFIFGGGEGTNYYGHLYVLDTINLHWTKPECTGKPPVPRKAHSSVSIGKRIYYFGGGDGNKALNETYILDTEKYYWELLKTEGQLPGPRGYHTTNLFGNNGKIYLYGGSDGQECLNDIYVLDINTSKWTKKTISNPLPCWSHSATVVGSWLFVFGGNDAKNNLNDLKILDLDSKTDTLKWIWKPCTGTPPSPRGYHTANLCDSRIFLIGGFDGTRCFGDTHVLDLGIYSYDRRK